MLQKDFLDQLKNTTIELSDTTKDQFLSIDPAILNTKPSAEKWSISECFKHLNLTLEIYLPQMTTVSNNSEKYPAKSDVFKHGILGKLAVKAMKPKANNQIPYKMKTFDNLKPKNANVNPVKEIDQFLKYQNEILTIIDGLKKVNLKKPKITTAVGPILKMSVGDALHFMVAHNQRHIVQAQNVLKIIQ